MLAVIDASPVGGGPLSRALACAAAECMADDVLRIRAYDLFGSVCSACSACVRSGRCTKRHSGLDETLAALAQADTLIVGLAGHLHAHDGRARALVERLVGAFGNVDVSRGVGAGRSPRSTEKRAAIVFASPPLLGIPAKLGMLPTGASGVWRVLERGGTRVVGCAAVGTRWSGPTSWDHASGPARALGRRLASVAPAAPQAAPSAVARLSTVLTSIRPV